MGQGAPTYLLTKLAAPSKANVKQRFKFIYYDGLNSELLFISVHYNRFGFLYWLYYIISIHGDTPGAQPEDIALSWHGAGNVGKALVH